MIFSVSTSQISDVEERRMARDGDRAGLGAGVLAVVAMTLCCAGPLLIVAVGALIAAAGWAVLGLGVGIVLLILAVALAVYRRISRLPAASPPTPSSQHRAQGRRS
jgi:membrane protein implicated in regulation of membrane protease activity